MRIVCLKDCASRDRKWTIDGLRERGGHARVAPFCHLFIDIIDTAIITRYHGTKYPTSASPEREMLQDSSRVMARPDGRVRKFLKYHGSGRGGKGGWGGS